MPCHGREEHKGNSNCQNHSPKVSRAGFVARGRDGIRFPPNAATTTAQPNKENQILFINEGRFFVSRLSGLPSNGGCFAMIILDWDSIENSSYSVFMPSYISNNAADLMGQMNISSYHIQNVIRAYGQRVGRKGLSQLKSTGQTVIPDVISISPEAKQRQITETVAMEIVSRVKGQDTELGANPRLAEKLGTELERMIEIHQSHEKGKGIKFRIVDYDKGETIKELSQKDTEMMMGSLYDMIEVRTVKDTEQEL
jgi:hypothetical protein